VYGIFERLGMDKDKYFKGFKSGQNLTDVDPFSVMGIFNRGLTNEKRIALLTEFSKTFEVSSAIPHSFNGIPVLNNINVVFFNSAHDDLYIHIERIWDLFEIAIDLADNPNQESEDKFKQIFGIVISQPYTKWMLTFGLYWIRPYRYVPLDNNTKLYLKRRGFKIKQVPNGESYFKICDIVMNMLDEKINSIPALSYDAWKKNNKEPSDTMFTFINDDDEGEASPKPPVIVKYSKENFLNKVYINSESYDTLKGILLRKKNIILQGSPGVGKTFAAERFAYSIMGKKMKAD